MKKNLVNDHLPKLENLEELRKSFRRNDNRYDFLTGLPSITSYFVQEDLGRKLNREKGIRSAILYFNLKGIRDYNRKFGFGEGDTIILHLAKTLEKYFGKDNCGRFGADHFSALTEAEGLEEILEKIFNEVKSYNEGNTLPLIVGIYLDDFDDVNASMACDRAKMACDAIKQSPHSAYHYFDLDMLEKETRRQYIIDNLDRAIEERWVQVYFQPIVRVISGRVSEEESLARWIDPEKGMISPGEFIPVLEETGLVYKLDLCVIEQVLEKMRLFHEKGMYVVPGSVNISRSDFDACDIVEEIRRRVDDAGIPRDRLIIEITESVIGSDFDYIKSQIERFRALGFKVWMDDFGSGYSSLDVLQNIQFDLIKLDMRFIQQFDNSAISRVILTEIMKMIAGIGAEALCEGVETKAQMEFLREIGCMKVQGFYFTKPISMDEVLRRYDKGIQIGLENPEEADYFAAISRFNVNDPTVVSLTNPDALAGYLDSIPVVILEADNSVIRPVRFNASGRDFMTHFILAGADLNEGLSLEEEEEFVQVVNQCREEGGWIRFEDLLKDGTSVQGFMRLLKKNPVTGAKAVAVIILAVISSG